MVKLGKELRTLLQGQLSECRLCPRECRVDRTRGQTGFCGVGLESRYIDELVQFSEEKRLIPSYAVFFTGCNLRCRFCYNYEHVVNPCAGTPVDVRLFRRRISRHCRDGVKTVNLIGGEPTCNLPAIAGIFDGLRITRPVIWNSNFYFSEVSRELILAIADVLLADFKFGSDACARRLAGVRRYVEVVGGNLVALAARRDTIVRHLMVPGHFDCCTVPVIEWLAENLPGVEVSIFGSYMPPAGPGTLRELNRTVTMDEYEKALRLAGERRLRLAQ